MNFKDAFTPAPEEFHQNLVSTLTSLEEGKKMKKAMIRSPLIAAVIIALVVSIAFATGINPNTDITVPPTASNQPDTSPISASAPAERETTIFAEKRGDIITFGSYEQDNNLENGAEPIEWLVLDIQDGRALVISKYALDTQPIHNTIEEATWETCDLRAWLNGEFMDIAFTDAEQAKIPTVTVEAQAGEDFDGNPVDPGNDTEDQIFVMSAAEYRNTEYFPSKDFRACKATAYAIAKGAWIYDAKAEHPDYTEARLNIEQKDNGNCFWWLRTPGSVQGSFTLAHFDGSRAYFGLSDLDHADDMFAHQPDRAGAVCVRPAMWIELDIASDAADETAVVTTPSPEATYIAEKIGNIITFGSYEQDNNLENGAEPIEWQILDIQDGRALVISKYALDTQPIHNTHEEATWETCDLRAWLNGEFMDIAFTETEQAKIPTVTVVAHKDRDAYSVSSMIPADINPGNDTEDQVFLLSSIEFYHYFNGAGARRCKATEYAIAKGAWVHDGETEYLSQRSPKQELDQSDYGYCFWWMRSPGMVQGTFVYANADGHYLLNNSLEHTRKVFAYNSSREGYICVRPAMWIKLNAASEAIGEAPAATTTPNPTPVNSENSAAATKELTIVGGYTFDGRLTKAIEIFQERHPEYKVKLEEYPYMNPSEINTGLTQNEPGYDIVLMSHDDSVPYIASGILMDLSENTVIADNLAQWLEMPFLWESNGSLYGIPFSVQPQGFMVVRKNLEALDLDIDSDWTWEDFLALTEELPEDGVMNLTMDTQSWNILFEQYESKYRDRITGEVNYDTETFRQLIAMWDQLIEEDQLAYGYNNVLLEHGYMGVNEIPVGIPEKDYVYLGMPLLDGEYVTPIIMDAYYINKNSEHADTAVELLEILTTLEAQMETMGASQLFVEDFEACTYYELWERMDILPTEESVQMWMHLLKTGKLTVRLENDIVNRSNLIRSLRMDEITIDEFVAALQENADAAVRK